MEYRSGWYQVQQNGPNCKFIRGFVCGNGPNPADNWFANRWP
jgi:hypothetical protein